MIQGRQIPVCSKAARRLEELKLEVRKVEEELRAAGLHDRAGAVGSIAEHIYEEAAVLERVARQAFAAARRGEELPK